MCANPEALRVFLTVLISPGWQSLSLNSLAEDCCINMGMKSSGYCLHCTEHGDKALRTTERIFYE